MSQQKWNVEIQFKGGQFLELEDVTEIDTSSRAFVAFEIDEEKTVYYPVVDIIEFETSESK